MTGGEPHGAVVVCPGGGYGGRAPHEAAVIAERFNQEGVHAFVVHYRVAPSRHPAPIMDVSRALRMVRSRAAAWRVRADRIAVCGFSAGGHLAASRGVLSERYPFMAEDDLHALSNRPDAMILAYPVISSGPFGHRGSFENLLGPNAAPALLQEMSLELQVTPRTPPAFLWHTADDAAVPVENSLLLFEALRRHQVGAELHVYPSGPHGLGLAPDNPHIATWMSLCGQWLRGMGW